jgi:gamma-glutamyltranspeptidase / glutathione hydrolase
MPSAPEPGVSRSQARSMTICREGIVATSQTLASQAGAQALARGGSAMDAAIVANIVLAVVEPMSCGIGGDLFAIYRENANGRLSGINASGWSPRDLTIECTGGQLDGIHSVTVPGCVDGWARLHRRFGRLPWPELFAPAIHYATEGFPVTEIIAEHWEKLTPKLKANTNADRTYLMSGRAPRTGEMFRSGAMARALQLIADNGPDAFYRGPIGKALLATCRDLGGVMCQEDLAGYESEWVEPVSTSYRGWEIYELPPNGQGFAALEMLNICEQFPLHQYGPNSADTLHLKIEAQKLAYQDLQAYLADPRTSEVPLANLISKPYARERAEFIDCRRARGDHGPGQPMPRGDTVYLCAVDREGNIASLIQSIYQGFGSGIVVPEYGVALHNRGALFSLDPAHPNALAGRKRPFHTIIPALMQKDRLNIGFGIMGGYNQAQAHAQFVSNVADHGMNLQAALEAPRFTKLTFGGCDLAMESRFPAETLEQLRSMGHEITLAGEFAGQMGGGQAVMHDAAARVNYGASSPRKDGAAIPEPWGG